MDGSLSNHDMSAYHCYHTAALPGCLRQINLY